MSSWASIAIANLLSRSKDARAVFATRTEAAHAFVQKKRAVKFTLPGLITGVQVLATPTAQG